MYSKIKLFLFIVTHTSVRKSQPFCPFFLKRCQKRLSLIYSKFHGSKTMILCAKITTFDKSTSIWSNFSFFHLKNFSFRWN